MSGASSNSMRSIKGYSGMRNEFKYLIILLLLSIILIGARNVDGITPPGSDARSDQNQTMSVHVVSDKLVVDSDKKTADFIGHVLARQDETTIRSDKLTIHYADGLMAGDRQEAAGEQAVREIIATGNVRINFDNRVAVGDKAVYTASDRILVLTGQEATVSNSRNSITGEKITVYRADGRMIAERGERKQVEVIVTTDDNGID